MAPRPGRRREEEEEVAASAGRRRALRVRGAPAESARRRAGSGGRAARPVWALRPRPRPEGKVAAAPEPGGSCARGGRQGPGDRRPSALLFAAARRGGDPAVPEPAGPCGARLGVAGWRAGRQTDSRALVRRRAPLRRYVEELARTEFDNEALAQPSPLPGRAAKVSFFLSGGGGWRPGAPCACRQRSGKVPTSLLQIEPSSLAWCLL